jgi:hypothetical protein
MPPLVHAGTAVTHLANILENHLNKPQVSDMEDREGESDVAEMACAELQGLHACCALADLARRALGGELVDKLDWTTRNSMDQNTYQSGIERAMLVGCAVVLNVVEHLIRDLEDGLIDNVLVGPGAGLSATTPQKTKQRYRKESQHTEYRT